MMEKFLDLNYGLIMTLLGFNLVVISVLGGGVIMFIIALLILIGGIILGKIRGERWKGN